MADDISDLLLECLVKRLIHSGVIFEVNRNVRDTTKVHESISQN